MNDSPFPGPDVSDERLGRQFVDLAHRLVRGDDVLDPHLVLGTALEAVPSAQACALVALRPDRPPRALATTDDTAAAVVRLQARLHEGPLLDARPGRGVVGAPDLATDARWPTFGPRCAATTGVRSLLSLRLPLGPRDRAAFSVYALEPGAFDEADVTSISMLAPFATLAAEACLRVQEVGNLTAALESNRQIGIAVGIVMASHAVTSEEAFDLLRTSSMNLNRKLRDVAEEVRLTGTVPGPPLATPVDGAEPPTG